MSERGSAPRDRLKAPSADFHARREAGRNARRVAPRRGQGPWRSGATRTDPVSLLETQAESRVPELVPIRYERMMVSPFTFFRGAALIMASDLAATGNSGITVQLCGDAHLSNFGLFGSAERRLVFDINDFDETLPGPFEWDVKRLVASFEVAGRHRGFTDDERRELRNAAARGYRERMRASAEASVLDAWYDTLDAERVQSWLRHELKAERAEKRQVEGFESVVAKARTKDRLRAFSKLVATEAGHLRIVADPPLIVPVEDIVGGDHLSTEAMMRELLASYQTTLVGDRHPVSEYSYVHMARKVVGIGSAGTRAWIILLTGRDDADPILLQAKEAQASVLERFLGPSGYQTHGERVVRGQRMMQASSDIFLGWQQGFTDANGLQSDFYVRQLHDWKGGLDPELMVPRGAMLYARVCGETLARAHARAGDRVEIAAYLGRSRVFDEAVENFAESYADQNEADYRAFIDAIDKGLLRTTSG